MDHLLSRVQSDDLTIITSKESQSHLFRFEGLTRGISSAGRAPALHAGGQRFDPAILHHNLLEDSIFLKPNQRV